MKLQYLAVIFVIIILPILLVLSFYMQSQIDILSTQTSYTSKLNDATYDAIKSFQINTTNSYYSSVSDSKIRDIEASVNTFYNSLTASLHYTKSDLQAYVPAIVYTLYDGYYIYGKRYNVYEVERKGGDDAETKDEVTKVEIATNTENVTDPDKYEYGLKPFVYYSCRYKIDSQNDFVVNFTLDNFISIYGTIKGNYETRYGYLIKLGDWDEGKKTYKGAEIQETEELKEYLKFSKGVSEGIRDGEYTYVVYQNQKVYKNGSTYFWYDQGTAKLVNSQEIINSVRTGQSRSSVEYYQNADSFSKWVNDNIGGIIQGNIVDGDKLEFNAGEDKIFEMTKQDPEDASSTFNQHRIAVIKNAIETNLIAAINSYNSNASSYAYALPQLTEEEWDKVVNNVCIISFMQGLPMGGKYFNNYVVIPNDKNNEFVDVDSVYLLTDDGQYHMGSCPLLVERKTTDGTAYTANIIGGYINTSFTRQTIDETYYYHHVQNKNASQPYTACYHCIVNASGKYDLENDIFMNTSNKIGSYDITTLRKKYLTILSREKYNLYKTNN